MVTGSGKVDYRRISIVIMVVQFFIGTVITPLNAGSKTQLTPLDGTSPLSDTSGTFSLLPIPKPGDWLAENSEKGQTFEQFLDSPRNNIERGRSVIHLQPIWDIKKRNGPPLHYLKKFAEFYFSMPVKVKRTIHPPEQKFSMRINPWSYNLQANADLLLKYLMERVPSRAYCVLGVTMTDLYPDPLWNYVFGYATYKERVGVFSFARYTQSFHDVSAPSNPKLLFLRSCKILAHETGHMFGIAHCTAWHCVMNGCNNLRENDAQPIHLCPVCLKKLQHAISFDVEKRYEELNAFYHTTGLYAEARWVRNRIDILKTSNE